MNGKIFSSFFSKGRQSQLFLVCYFATRRNEFGQYSIVTPETVSEKLYVPRYIVCPPYVQRITKSDVSPKKPEIKCDREILKMRKSCTLARKILDTVAANLRVGITTDEIDKMVHKLCIDNNAYPSPLGYHGFPKSVCTSVNNVACHGIPDNRPLISGDIINIDVSVYVDGHHGDCCGTYAIGEVDEQGLDLIEGTKQCLKRAISICRDGEDFSTIGRVITETANSLGLTVVPCFAGHGIGRYFHGPPDILHCENDTPGQMKTGMTFTIEPVVTQGEPDIVVLEDGWTAVTADNARAAQFEHTILINGSSAEILTLSSNSESE